jgi:hypothetical protein
MIGVVFELPKLQIFKNMKISETHQLFALWLNNQRALSHPDEFLGPNWKDVLNFWLYLDTLSDEQLNMSRTRFCNLDVVDRVSSWKLAWDISCGVVGGLYINILFPSSTNTHAGGATRELIGAHKILKRGKSLMFVPMFLNL